MPSSLFGSRMADQSPKMNQPVNPQINSSGFQAPSNFSQIKGFMELLKSGGNVQQLVQNAIMNNSQYGEVMKYVNQHGGDPKAAFYAMAKEKGIDPNTIIDMLK